MHPDSSFTNQLLIAMPGMLDPNFSTTVTLICEHNDEGALGIVINRPTTLKMGGLFEQLSVEDADPEAAELTPSSIEARLVVRQFSRLGAPPSGRPAWPPGRGASKRRQPSSARPPPR